MWSTICVVLDILPCQLCILIQQAAKTTNECAAHFQFENSLMRKAVTGTIESAYVNWLVFSTDSWPSADTATVAAGSRQSAV